MEPEAKLVKRLKEAGKLGKLPKLPASGQTQDPFSPGKNRLCSSHTD